MYSRPMPRALWWSWGGGRFLVSEVPLHKDTSLTDLSPRFLAERERREREAREEREERERKRQAAPLALWPPTISKYTRLCWGM
jgi:hypothetical protein